MLTHTNLSPDTNLRRKKRVDVSNPILDTGYRRDKLHRHQIARCMHACVRPCCASEVNLRNHSRLSTRMPKREKSGEVP